MSDVSKLLSKPSSLLSEVVVSVGVGIPLINSCYTARGEAGGEQSWGVKIKLI